VKPATEVFTETLLEDRYRVCGKLLKPFTLGHAQLFLHFGLGSLSSVSDLALAILICSMSPERFRRLYYRRGWPFRVWWWGVKVGQRLRKPGLLDRELAVWCEYYEYSNRCPDFEPASKVEEHEVGAPFLYHLRVVLLSRLGYRPETVSQVVLRQAWADYVVLMERDHTAKVLNGIYGENIHARFAEADARHEERVAKHLAQRNGERENLNE